jgi:hypothetical protein
MREELKDQGWRRRLENLTTKEAWGKFREKVGSLVTTFVPIMRRRNHNRPKWMTRDILKALRRKNGCGRQ